MKITDDDGESWEFTHTHVGQGEKIIAQVQHQTKDSGWPHVHDVNEMWANARLIASAPTMYKYLTLLAERGNNEAHEIIKNIARP